MENSHEAQKNPLSRLERIPVWPYSYTLLCMVGIAYAFAFYDVTNISYALPVIQKQFNISETTAATSVTTGLIGYIVGSLIISYISDRFGRRPGLLMAVACFTLGSIASAFSPNITWLNIWRFIVGMGIGAMIAQVATYMGEITPAKIRGRSTAISNVFSYAGASLTPVIAMWLVPHYSWGWRALLAFGAVGGIIVLIGIRSFKESPRWLMTHGRKQEVLEIIERAEERGAQRYGKPLPPIIDIPLEVETVGGIRSLFRPPYIRYAILFLMIWLIWYIGVYIWLGLAPTFLVEKGYGLANSISFMVVINLGFVVGAIYVAFLGDRFERKYLLMIHGCLWALFMILLGLIPSPTMIMVAGFFATAFGCGGVSIITYVLTAEHFPTHIRSIGMSVGDGVGHFGAALSPYIGLWAFNGFGFSGPFITAAITGIITVLLFPFTARTTGKPLEVVVNAEVEGA